MDWPFDVKAFLKTLSTGPGIYQMIGADDEVIYVGKARNLQRRVGSYFTRGAHPTKTLQMLSLVQRVEITLTRTEGEALLLENNLIKQHQPRYNVMLRDDKSYPYLLLTDHRFPRVAFHRGAKRVKGRYFGPYPSAKSTRSGIGELQRLFRLRPCEDSYFENRSRPCLQYQIERCSGPCVGLVSEADYERDLRHATLFLEGKGERVQRELEDDMERAAAALEFERAARVRDRIRTLRRVQEKQYITGTARDIDIVAIESAAETVAVVVMFVRGGRHLGHKTYFPKQAGGIELDEALGEFVARYYSEHHVPDEIIVDREFPELEFVAAALSDRAERKVEIKHRVRAERVKWREMASMTAQQSLSSKLAVQAGVQQRLDALAQAMSLDETPARIECFDISHTMGEATVASCVVFDAHGPKKTDYRKFNITGIEPGDDYAAMRQAMMRRYRRIKTGEVAMPDILLIDGGKGQLRQAVEVLAELEIEGILLVGVAKGPARRPGEEQLFLLGQKAPTILPVDSPALHLVQQVRDEAHRFAITGHRGRRAKARRESVLEEIPGLGPKRRQALLKAFGGIKELQRAGLDELSVVPGISRELAQKVYDRFHAN